ncbi:MAG TPA: aldose epimerase family protein [Xanthobacteraceae bacterium]|nr:aldose epimerase family protein [Xanthobacteraceae bacterium]
MAEPDLPGVSRHPFGRLDDGTAVELVRLIGAGGFEARIISFGAAVQALLVPDRAGQLADVVLGQDDLAAYVAHRRFYGATVGRYANRIAGAAFTLDGQTVQLAANNGRNALHGGPTGFDRHVWSIDALGAEPQPFVRLSRVSPEGEEGYPGTLKVTATYTLTGGTGLAVSYEAETDRATMVCLTNHSFFNLSGVEAGGSVLEHRLSLTADHYLPVDSEAIPRGAPAPVEGTPFDFRSAWPVGARIRTAHEQLRLGRGYDHCYCLNGTSGAAPRLAARLEEPVSGRVMELLTDQPGLQLYSGNFIDGAALGKYGQLHRQSDALCLEPQNFPDTPNRPDYPSARLDPGQVYRHRTIYRFSVA